MSKKNRLKVAVAALLAATMTIGATACDAFFTTDNEANMKQIVASVNISSLLGEDESVSDDAAKGVKDIIKNVGLNTDIPKRDLVAFFMSTGYQYVESYGYEKTFEMLLDTLIDRKVLVQYALAYFLQNQSTDYTAAGCQTFVETAIENETDEVVKGLLKKHPEVLVMEYFLTTGARESAEETKDYQKALYSLHKSVNDSLDSAEENYIKEKEDTHDHGTVRTTPTNVGVEKEDYFIAPKDGKSYAVYTGQGDNDDPALILGYEKLDGSTATTRTKAYNAFLRNLQSNGLILDGENTTNFTKLDYYYVELANQLETSVITKYTDALKETAEKSLVESETGVDSYVEGRYKATLAQEEKKYEEDESAFETAIGSLSDTALPLYAPAENYGLVYNILIPFSKAQSNAYAAENERDVTSQELAAYRTTLLAEVAAKDLRTSWFSDYEDDNYAYTDESWVSGTDYYGTSSGYLFFEDNFNDTERYESLGQYYGKYAFNGSVEIDKKDTETTDDDEFVIKPNKMSIGSFITEMENYISYAMDAEGYNGWSISGDTWDGYVTDADDYAYDEDKKEFTDYSQFMYYTGKVEFGETPSAANYFVEDTQAYTALSAFNELMFAYSTDTGCLNTYMGYVVSPYKTSFVPEFEYAAQYAIRELGVGGYVVCPSTYGWHIIYVSFVYEPGEVYGGFNKDDVDTEGSFSQLYFDMIKSSYADEYAQKVQETAIEKMNKGSSVTRYKDRYKDLTELG